jgi:hypothetical protein
MAAAFCENCIREGDYIMRIWHLGLASIVASLFWGATARAELIFAFDQSSYTVSPGGTVDVLVSLEETQTMLLVSNNGLESAGVLLTGIAPLPTQPADVLTDGDIMNNPGFDQANPIANPGAHMAQLAEFVLLNPGPVLATGAGPYEVFLGTFRYTASTIVGETTTVQATRLDPGGEFFQYGDGSQVGDENVSPASFTITVVGSAVVPEPSTFALMAFGLGLAGMARNRFYGAKN